MKTNDSWSGGAQVSCILHHWGVQLILGGSVGCVVRLETRVFNPHRGRQHSFVEIDHEIFSTVILSLPLIQEGQCQFLTKECAQYWLTT